MAAVEPVSGESLRSSARTSPARGQYPNAQHRLGLALSLVAFGALSTVALAAQQQRATAEEVVVR
jgi:hypothetical protein